MHRRRFLAGAAAAGLLYRAEARAESGSPVIDALGEVRIDYPMSLIDEIIDSGTSACVVTVGNPALQGPEALDDTRAEIAAYESHLAAHPDRLMRGLSIADVAFAARQKRLALIFYPQNASPLGDSVSAVELLWNLGVRILQLTYNTRNLLGDGCLERTNAGLSRFGLAVVERMNEAGMLVDVSHCGSATTSDAIEHSRAPVAVTHSGCSEVFAHPRNKSDETLRKLADRGGVIGIYQINPYLGPSERNTLDQYLAHIDHAVDVAGIDHVGIGSDREHRRIPDTEAEKQKLVDELSRLTPGRRAQVRWPFFLTELNHPRRMTTIAEALAAAGRPQREIEKLLGGNFLRLFGETFG